MTGRQEGGAWWLLGEANRVQTGELSWQEQGLSHSDALLPQEASVHQKSVLARGTSEPWASTAGEEGGCRLSLLTVDKKGMPQSVLQSRVQLRRPQQSPRETKPRFQNDTPNSPTLPLTPSTLPSPKTLQLSYLSRGHLAESLASLHKMPAGPTTSSQTSLFLGSWATPSSGQPGNSNCLILL